MGIDIFLFFLRHTVTAMAFVPIMILRTNFGRRFVGLRRLLFLGWLGASAVFMLSFAAEVAGSGASVLTFLLWAVGIGFAIRHNREASKNLKRGRLQLSQYDGYPWISIWTGWNEFPVKALVEPGVVVVVAWFIGLFDPFTAFWLYLAGFVMFVVGCLNWIAYKDHEYKVSDDMIEAGLTQEMEGVQVATGQVREMAGMGTIEAGEPQPRQRRRAIAQPLHNSQPVMLPAPEPKALPPAPTPPVVAPQPVRQAASASVRHSDTGPVATPETEPLRFRQRPFTVRSGSRRRAETVDAVGFSGPGGIQMRRRGTIVNRPRTTVDQVPMPPPSPSPPEPTPPTPQQPPAPPPVQSTPRQVPHLARGSSLDPRLLQLMDDDENDY